MEPIRFQTHIWSEIGRCDVHDNHGLAAMSRKPDSEREYFSRIVHIPELLKNKGAKMATTKTAWLDPGAATWQLNPLLDGREDNSRIAKFNRIDPSDTREHADRYDGYGAVYSWGKNPDTGKMGWEKTGQLPPDWKPGQPIKTDQIAWSSDNQVAVENHYQLQFGAPNPLAGRSDKNSVIEGFKKLNPNDGSPFPMRYDGNGAIYKKVGDSYQLAGYIPKEAMTSKNGGVDESKIVWGEDI